MMESKSDNNADPLWTTSPLVITEIGLWLSWSYFIAAWTLSLYMDIHRCIVTIQLTINGSIPLQGPLNFPKLLHFNSRTCTSGQLLIPFLRSSRIVVRTILCKRIFILRQHLPGSYITKRPRVAPRSSTSDSSKYSRNETYHKSLILRTHFIKKKKTRKTKPIQITAYTTSEFLRFSVRI